MRSDVSEKEISRTFRPLDGKYVSTAFDQVNNVISLEVRVQQWSLFVRWVTWHEVLLKTWTNNDFCRREKLLGRTMVIPMPMTPYDRIDGAEVDTSLSENIVNIYFNLDSFDDGVQPSLSGGRVVFEIFSCATVEEHSFIEVRIFD